MKQVWLLVQIFTYCLIFIKLQNISSRTSSQTCSPMGRFKALLYEVLRLEVSHILGPYHAVTLYWHSTDELESVENFA